MSMDIEIEGLLGVNQYRYDNKVSFHRFKDSFYIAFGYSLL